MNISTAVANSAPKGNSMIEKPLVINL